MSSLRPFALIGAAAAVLGGMPLARLQMFTFTQIVAHYVMSIR